MAEFVVALFWFLGLNCVVFWFFFGWFGTLFGFVWVCDFDFGWYEFGVIRWV